MLLGTDHAPVCDTTQKPAYRAGAATRLELVALVNAGLTPYEALATGTVNVAKYFETLAETGTVEVGKRADLVLLNSNPLQTFDGLVRPAGVMLGGRWLSRADLDALARSFGVTMNEDGSWTCAMAP